MYQALQELFKDEINEKITKSNDDMTVDYLKDIMKKLKYTAEQAMDLINIPQENRAALLKRL